MRRNNRFVFQQENARPHIARLSVNFLQANNVKTLSWPSRSPELTPIEHIFDMLNRRIRDNHYPFNSLQEFENALIIEWNTIPQYKNQKITSGMQKRCRATITANEAWTRYWHCWSFCESIMCHVLHFVNMEVCKLRGFFCTFMLLFIVVIVW
jgi:hypothetical protein